MRLDKSLYHLFGDGLMGLTRERESIVNPGTYEWRSLFGQALCRGRSSTGSVSRCEVLRGRWRGSGLESCVR